MTRPAIVATAFETKPFFNHKKMVKVTALGSLLPEIFVFMYIQNTFFTLLAN